MSSNYRPICMSHDPALVIETDWASASFLEAALADPGAQEETAQHVGCDLIGGAWSYPLVRVYCPPGKAHSHSVGYWIDVEWLRLVHLTATTWPNSEKLAAIYRSLPACWKPERIAKLAAEL